MSSGIRVAIVGVGDDENSLVKGIQWCHRFYKNVELAQRVPGLVHDVIADYNSIYPVCNLYNCGGLSISPFRMDSWK
jgi:hypothetical protein